MNIFEITEQALHMLTWEILSILQNFVNEQENYVNVRSACIVKYLYHHYF